MSSKMTEEEMMTLINELQNKNNKLETENKELEKNQIPIDYYEYENVLDDDEEIIGYKFKDFEDWWEYLRNNPNELKLEIEASWTGYMEGNNPMVWKNEKEKLIKPSKKKRSVGIKKPIKDGERRCECVMLKSKERCENKCNGNYNVCTRHLRHSKNPEKKLCFIDGVNGVVEIKEEEENVEEDVEEKKEEEKPKKKGGRKKKEEK